MNEIVRVDLGARSYDIHIGQGLIDSAGAALAPVIGKARVVIVSDDRVWPLYGPRLSAALTEAGIDNTALTVAAGEASKSWAVAGDLTERLIGQGLERSTVVVALGGGVIGDLAGFVAAIALRGVPFVQVPTTLLAQVDSAVGGKTGINSPSGKNLIGAFHQPVLVLADIDTLKTLPARERLAGYAEVVKYGLIDRPTFFDWLEREATALLAGDPERLVRAIGESVRAKAAIVADDEREAGRRALLNLGHTFGHALEAAIGYGDRLRHGEAVAIGLVLAFDLSARLGLCPPADAARVRHHLAAVGLPVGIPDDVGSPDDLLALMARDKKVSEGRITFILARGIGRAFVSRDADLSAVSSQLAEAVAA